MIDKNAAELLKKYQKGECSPEESAWVESWYLNLSENSKPWDSPIDYEHKEAEIWAKLDNDASVKPNVHKIWPRIAVAAAVLLAFLTISILFVKHQKDKHQSQANQMADLLPGGNKATLILANGSKVILNNSKNGTISTQGNVVVNKKSDGQLVYQAAGNNAQTVLYNTITTPKGGQYRITLADGTRVLLNAESSLKFPASFNGNERLVELTGEAYFEVVHDSKTPFKVRSGDQLVQDVGTHFDIKAYTDEAGITTTLLEGAVNVSPVNAPAQTTSLKPNQQTAFSNGTIKLIPDADVELATGWIDGHFRFKDASIQQVMRELARWYDVDVVYEGTPPHDLFTGSIHRDIKASQALEILSFFKVAYRIEGKKIIITS